MNNRKPTKQIDRYLTLEGEERPSQLRAAWEWFKGGGIAWEIFLWVMVFFFVALVFLWLNQPRPAGAAEPVMVSVDFQSPASWRYFFTVIRGWKFVDQGPQAENRGREYCANHGELIGLKPGESLFIGFQKIGRMRIERCVESYPLTPKEAQTFCAEYGMTLQAVTGTVVTCSRGIGA